MLQQMIFHNLDDTSLGHQAADKENNEKSIAVKIDPVIFIILHKNNKVPSQDINEQPNTS